MTTKNTVILKNKALQQFYDAVELHIKRDFAEPIVYKGRPTWMGGDGAIKLDTERETERQIQLHRKYDEMVKAAISIWESYPDCSKPPMSNPSPKIGLHELLAWAREEQKKEQKPIETGGEAGKTKNQKPAETGGNATAAKGWGIWTWVKSIPRWIYFLVLFFAALLTCVYFSWWLWTTFWKK